MRFIARWFSVLVNTSLKVAETSRFWRKSLVSNTAFKVFRRGERWGLEDVRVKVVYLSRDEVKEVPEDWL